MGKRRATGTEGLSGSWALNSEAGDDPAHMLSLTTRLRRSSVGATRAAGSRRLKIDRTFVRGVDRDRDLGSMMQAMIQLASNLGMTPLAEGIETAEELDFLVEHGCPLGQGFFLGRSVRAPPVACPHDAPVRPH